VSVSELPEPGHYRDGTDVHEIRISKRGHWYAMCMEPDGSATYLAQDVDLAALTPMSERPPSDCALVGCRLPQWHRGLCGLHLAADAVRRARGAA
jgi:hypothetical protein